MKTKTWTKSGWVLFFIVLAAAALVTQEAISAQKVINWKCQSAYVDKDLSTDLQARGLAKEVEKATNGRLRIKVYPEGALCSALEIFDYLKRGVFQMAMSSDVYNTSIIGDVGMLTLLPFAYTNIKDEKELFQNKGLYELLRKVYVPHNIHHLGIWPCGSYGAFGNFAVNKIEDFKGKRMRAWGPYAKILTALGASPVSFAGAEQYMALKLGTVDGSFWSTAELSVLKFYEVAKYYLKPPWSIANAAIFVNLDAWKSLPEDIRKSVQDLNDSLSFGKLLDEYMEAEAEALRIAQEKKMQIVTLPDSELARLRQVAMPVWDEYAKKDDKCAAFIKIIKDYYGMK